MKIDDFESYKSTDELSEAWKHPPHGGWIRQTLDLTEKHSGTQCMKVEYRTLKEPKLFYCPICTMGTWDLSGCNAFQFWLKPDGFAGNWARSSTAPTHRGRTYMICGAGRTSLPGAMTPGAPSPFRSLPSSTTSSTWRLLTGAWSSNRNPSSRSPSTSVGATRLSSVMACTASTISRAFGPDARTFD